MLKSEFDSSFFESVFDLASLRQNAPNELMKPSGEIITSPYHITTVELLRKEAIGDAAKPKAKATDVFIFAEGEPVNQAGTKVGGLPFLANVSDWPGLRDGKPKTFVGQLCFTDSKDILPTLPGDVLLVFADHHLILENPDDRTAIEFRWAHSARTEVISQTDIPQTDWKISPYFGIRHRTMDYFYEVAAFSAYDQHWLLFRLQGTKVGGLPNWIQTDPQLPGEFIGSIGSVIPEFNKPFPYVNRPDPMPISYDTDNLIWDDAGCLYIFWEKAHLRNFTKKTGVLHWELQSY